jgi:hypothetical protein
VARAILPNTCFVVLTQKQASQIERAFYIHIEGKAAPTCGSAKWVFCGFDSAPQTLILGVMNLFVMMTSGLVIARERKLIPPICSWATLIRIGVWSRSVDKVQGEL